jgi:hypothetical protein
LRLRHSPAALLQHHGESVQRFEGGAEDFAALHLGNRPLGNLRASGEFGLRQFCRFSFFPESHLFVCESDFTSGGTDVSTVLLFRRTFLRLNVNIQSCFTPQRNDKLKTPVRNERPWASAIYRLLRERGLNAVDLIGHAGFKRGPTISAYMNSEKASPNVASLRQIANAIEAADKRLNDKNAKGPVEFWEFFVSEDQADLLRKAAAARQQLAGGGLSDEDKRDLELARRVRAAMDADKADKSEPVQEPVAPPRVVQAKKKR